QARLESYGARDPLGQHRQRLAAAQRLRPDEMEPEIAVAELEPGLAAEPLDRVEGVPGLLRAAPSALLVSQAGERVEQRVQVRRDVEAVHLEVVADIGDHGQVTRRHDLTQRPPETGP